MKKVITLVFGLSLVVYWSGISTYAQGKGSGRNPGAPAGQSRTPTSKTKSDEHAEHAKTEKADKDKKENHEAKETKNQEKFEERIESNPQLKARVESLLPTGMNLKTAATGFRNQGEF